MRPFADEFVERHFQAWLERYVHEDGREEVERKIRKLLADDPGLGGRGWPDLREMAGA
jgi:hypothetical protein